MNIPSIDPDQMSVKVDLVQSLYSVIEEIGKQNIQKDLVSSDLQASRKYIRIILDNCLLRLRNISKIEITDDMILDLCEALLHFMLTASTLPSARKIEVDRKIRIDLVIPNVTMHSENSSEGISYCYCPRARDYRKYLTA